MGFGTRNYAGQGGLPSVYMDQKGADRTDDDKSDTYSSNQGRRTFAILTRSILSEITLAGSKPWFLSPRLPQYLWLDCNTHS